MNNHSNNIFQHSFSVTKENRQCLHGHKSYILWFTGLSGSGKSTIANSLERKLFDGGISTYILDGDNLRNGLNQDLGFSEQDRKENIRRVGEVSKLLVDCGVIVLSTFISPFRVDREAVRELVGPDEFIEISIDCPLQLCEKRDPKGLYKKARKGEIKDFTGISSPYENPMNPELVLDTAHNSVEQCVLKIYSYLKSKGYLSS